VEHVRFRVFEFPGPPSVGPQRVDAEGPKIQIPSFRDSRVSEFPIRVSDMVSEPGGPSRLCGMWVPAKGPQIPDLFQIEIPSFRPFHGPFPPSARIGPWVQARGTFKRDPQIPRFRVSECNS